MLDEIMSPAYRQRYADPAGHGRTPGSAWTTWAIRTTRGVGTRATTASSITTWRVFEKAGAATMLAFTDHDLRDMRTDVHLVPELSGRVAPKYPEVAWRHAGALDAAPALLGPEAPRPIELATHVTRGAGSMRVDASAKNTNCSGRSRSSLSSSTTTPTRSTTSTLRKHFSGGATSSTTRPSSRPRWRPMASEPRTRTARR